MTPYYRLDKHKNAIPVEDNVAGRFLFDEENRVVQQDKIEYAPHDEVTSKYFVSTVFLVIARGGDLDRQDLFETMVFQSSWN